MSLLAPLNLRESVLSQHVVLNAVSWDDYEHCLQLLDGDPTRVTYFEGEMEIMPPPIGAEHENRKSSIGRLIDHMTFARRIRCRGLGSCTFRKEKRLAGLEPDGCYYIGDNAARLAGIVRFDATVHPMPDLAVEVEVSSWITSRLRVYAALGIPEIWRQPSESHIEVLHLEGGQFVEAASSMAFPFLPMKTFEVFAGRMVNEDQLDVLTAFDEWVRGL